MKKSLIKTPIHHSITNKLSKEVSRLKNFSFFPSCQVLYWNSAMSLHWGDPTVKFKWFDASCEPEIFKK